MKKKVITRDVHGTGTLRKVKSVNIPVAAFKMRGVKGLIQAKGEALSLCRSRFDAVNAGPFAGLVRQVFCDKHEDGSSTLVVALALGLRTVNRIKAYQGVYDSIDVKA